MKYIQKVITFYYFVYIIYKFYIYIYIYIISYVMFFKKEEKVHSKDILKSYNCVK